MHKLAQVELQLDRPQLPYLEILGPIVAGGTPAHYRRRQPNPTKKRPLQSLNNYSSEFQYNNIITKIILRKNSLRTKEQNQIMIPISWEIKVHNIVNDTYRKNNTIWCYFLDITKSTIKINHKHFSCRCSS